MCKTPAEYVQQCDVPSPGDYIFYDWQDSPNYATTDNQGGADHVGIVEKVSGPSCKGLQVLRQPEKAYRRYGKYRP